MTDFHCCQEFADYIEEEEFTVKEISEIHGYNFCPFCGYKLTMLE